MSEPKHAQRDHAIVIGASIAGLLTARVLTNHFQRVTVIERDRLPSAPDYRKGVPQAHHVHLLLARGKQIMEALFPGLDADLEAHGVPSMHWGQDARYRFFSGWLPPIQSGIETRSVSRVLLEWLIYRRLAESTQVHFLDQHSVAELLTDPLTETVIGVRAESRQPGDEREAMLYADLVVDASGRNSKAPVWLKKLGYSEPQETIVNSYLGYATRWYRRTPALADKFIGVQAEPPHHPRAGVLMQVEGDRWIVTLVGVNKDYPPTDEQAFLEFARSLPTPVIFEAIKDADPLTSIYGYQQTENRQRHYQKLARWPEGFVVIGDAAAAFNPIYGQGMSIAAIEATALNQMLEQESFKAHDFQRTLSALIRVPWIMATGEDSRYPGTVGAQRGLVMRIMHWYIDQVIGDMPHSAETTLAFFRVMNLIGSPALMARPSILLRVLGNLLKKKTSFGGTNLQSPQAHEAHVTV